MKCGCGSLIAVALAVAAVTADWVQQSNGPWSGREGLMALSHHGSIFMTGGRGTDGLGFAQDLWKTENGSNWEQMKSPGYPRRAYHVMVEANDCMLVMGGQTFTSFYNDVWKSCDDGATWKQLPDAPWKARAGLAATVINNTIVIAGGCYNKGVTRSFLGDVWISADGGESWTNQPRSPGPTWSARSGPRLVPLKGELFLVAGERGFTAPDQLVDIWRSPDLGKSWTLATDKPGFSARSGHGVIPNGDELIVLAGWPELHDMWTTTDGASFTQTSDAVWGCKAGDTGTSCGKFDFWSLIHQGSLYTMGGSGATATFGKMYEDTWALAL